MHSEPLTHKRASCSNVCPCHIVPATDRATSSSHPCLTESLPSPFLKQSFKGDGFFFCALLTNTPTAGASRVGPLNQSCMVLEAGRATRWSHVGKDSSWDGAGGVSAHP